MLSSGTSRTAVAVLGRFTLPSGAACCSTLTTPPVEVDVSPLQPERLPDPQPRPGEQPIQEQIVRVGGGEQDGQLLPRERLRSLLAVRRWPLVAGQVRDGVPSDMSASDGEPEHAGRNDEIVLDRPGGTTRGLGVPHHQRQVVLRHRRDRGVPPARQQPHVE